MSNKLQTFSINKTKVVVYPVRNIRTCLIYVMVKAGSWYEGKKEVGTFHLLEHMLNQGNRSFKNRNEVEIFKQTHGISSNASTSGRALSFWMKFPDISLGPALNYLEDTLFYPTFPETELQREKEVITQEIKGRLNDPRARFYQFYKKCLYGKNHIYAFKPINEIENIKETDSSQLKKLHKRYFQPQNMVISVVGNVEFNKVKRGLEAILAKQKNSHQSKLVVAEPKPEKRVAVYKDTVDNAYLTVNWFLSDLDSMDTRDRIIAGRGKIILGKGPSSLLYKELRQKKGLVYWVEADTVIWPKASTLRLRTECDKEKIDEVIKAIRKSVVEFRKLNLSKEEFNRVKKFVKLNTYMEYDSIYSIAETLSTDLFYEGRVFTAEDYVRISDTVKKEEIKNLYYDSLAWDKAYIVSMIASKK